jgi:hypothetical protein
MEMNWEIYDPVIYIRWKNSKLDKMLYENKNPIWTQFI